MGEIGPVSEIRPVLQFNPIPQIILPFQFEIFLLTLYRFLHEMSKSVRAFYFKQNLFAKNMLNKSFRYFPVLIERKEAPQVVNKHSKQTPNDLHIEFCHRFQILKRFRIYIHHCLVPRHTRLRESLERGTQGGVSPSMCNVMLRFIENIN